MKVEVVEFLYRRGNIIALGLKSCSPASILFLPPKFPMNSDRHEIVFNSLTVATFVPPRIGCLRQALNLSSRLLCPL